MQSQPSYWERTTFIAPFDVLIIGSGIVGCVSALHFAASQRSLRIGIVDCGTLPTDAAWSGIIGIGPEKSPIVQMAGECIAVAVRLSGIGVAIGSLIGVQAAQLILSRI